MKNVVFFLFDSQSVLFTVLVHSVIMMLFFSKIVNSTPVKFSLFPLPLYFIPRGLMSKYSNSIWLFLEGLTLIFSTIFFIFPRYFLHFFDLIINIPSLHLLLELSKTQIFIFIYLLLMLKILNTNYFTLILYLLYFAFPSR